MPATTFKDWYERVDVEIGKQTMGCLSRDDLVDAPYADWHGSGMSPQVAARKALKRTKEG